MKKLSEHPRAVKLFYLTSIVIALLARVFNTFYFWGISNDKMGQSQATLNLNNGKGYSLTFASLENLSEAHQTPLLGWPPGYSVVQTVFYFFNKNIFLSSLLADLLFSVLFILLVHALIRYFKINHWAGGLLLLYFGFRVADYIKLSTATDQIAAVTALCSILMAGKMMEKGNSSLKSKLILSVMCFLPALFRFHYFPTVFIVPCYLYYSGWKKNNITWRKNGVFILITSGLCLLLLVIFLQYNSGKTVYVAPRENGFYPENLLKLHPFLFSSLADTELWYMLVAKAFATSFIKIKEWVTYFHLVLLVPMVVSFVVFFIKSNKVTTPAKIHIYRIYFLYSMVIFLVILFLAVTQAQDIPGLKTNAYWTYAQEERYFAFITSFIPVFLFAIYPSYKHLFTVRIAAVLITFLFVAEIFHGFYFSAKTIGKEGLHSKGERLEKSRQKIITSFKERYKSFHLVCITESYFTQPAPFYEINTAPMPSVLSLPLPTSKETAVLFVFSRNNRHRYLSFLKERKSDFMGEIDNELYYTIIIKPDAR